ncbi:hypothetical protein HMPREF0072_0265 [Anaerococcus lactolyticus ATCC 51172]|uniref:Uncharacterized protein n=1 Tax=Anaerococcus lactolyticus ATCC 51172 TaxID=525254 RepID=C2BD45_9FIRM|nr:hypothetical protein HMPREF0072_0265 [Anaerococcus lactolyticus ATCC 51172]
MKTRLQSPFISTNLNIGLKGVNLDLLKIANDKKRSDIYKNRNKIRNKLKWRRLASILICCYLIIGPKISLDIII